MSIEMEEPHPTSDYYDSENDDAAVIKPKAAYQIYTIRAWLNPLKYGRYGINNLSSTYYKHLKLHVLGTSAWLWQSEAYTQWANGSSTDSKVLWIEGDAGSGKSVLAAAIVKKLTDDAEARNEKEDAGVASVPVLSFFFRRTDMHDAAATRTRTPPALVCDLLDQLLEYSPALQARLMVHTDARATLDGCGLDRLWDHLCAALNLLDDVYCIVDGLNEMDEGNEAFVTKLLALGRRPNIRLFVTSRPGIGDSLGSDGSETASRIQMNAENMDVDISLIIEARLTGIKGQTNDESYHLLTDWIRKTSHRNSLYATLMIDGIVDRIGTFKSEEGSKVDAHKFKDELGRTFHGSKLGDVYRNMLLQQASNHPDISREQQLIILQWVIHSAKSLRLSELSSLLRFQQDGTGGQLPNGDRLIRASCGRLLEIEEPDEIISIAHHSVVEFLQATPDALQDRRAHRDMAFACLNYLKFRCLPALKAAHEKAKDLPNWRVDSVYETTLSEMRVNFPFSDYALRNWHYHFRKATDQAKPKDEKTDDVDELQTCLDTYLTSGGPLLDFRSISGEVLTALGGRCLTRLHVAGYYGMLDYAQYLIEKQCCEVNHLGTLKDGEPEDRCSIIERATPLVFAVRAGHEEIVRLLLEHGADQSIESTGGNVAIPEAALSDRHEVMTVLLKHWHGAEINHEYPAPGTLRAVQVASVRGYSNSMRVLLEYLDGGSINQALIDAARYRNTEIVQFLLDCEPEPEDEQERILRNSEILYAAAEMKQPQIIKLILQRGADPNLRLPDYDEAARSCAGPTGTRAIHMLCAGSMDHVERCFGMMLAAGADVNIQCDWGRTPLHYACLYSPEPRLAKCLLDAGADVTALTKKGESPLHLVAYAGEEFVRLLVDHGADVNAGLGREGQAPLHMAPRQPGTLSSLIQCGADVKAVDIDGKTPLHYVLRSEQPVHDCVRLLLEAGAEANARDNHGKTPFMAFSRLQNEHFACAEHLQRAGVDFNARDC